EEADLGADRSAMEDELSHGVAPEERLTELTRGDVPQPAQVLDGQRIREAEIVHDAHAIGRGHPRVAFHAENGHKRIARENAEHHEDDEGHPDEGATAKSARRARYLRMRSPYLRVLARRAPAASSSSGPAKRCPSGPRRRCRRRWTGSAPSPCCSRR